MRTLRSLIEDAVAVLLGSFQPAQPQPQQKAALHYFGRPA